MKQIKFGNSKAMLIQSSKVISKIKKKILNIGAFDISAKYYNFLNKKNINCIKKNKFLFTLNTFGKKHLLFLTKIGEKKRLRTKSFFASRFISSSFSSTPALQSSEAKLQIGQSSP